MRGASGRATNRPHGCVHDAPTEVQYLVDVLLIGLIAGQPIRERCTNRSMPLESADADNLGHRIGGIKAQALVTVCLRQAPCELDRVWGRGLLSHVREYPVGEQSVVDHVPKILRN
jgi:hypothetical protein